MSASVDQLQNYSPATSADRLSLTLFMAAAMHGIVILGVGFKADTTESRAPPTLDVILVQNHNPESPEEADYLAQVSQDGGGQSERRDRPQTPFSTPEKITDDGMAPIPQLAASPRMQVEMLEQVLSQRESDYQIQQSTKPQQSESPQDRANDREVKKNLAIAQLSAEINEKLMIYAKRPRKKFITARTKEILAASYMFRWVRRVEQIGNLNYPDDARRRKLSGSLVLVVGINKNGSINELILLSSSGHQILDDAARNIVKLAAPFEPITGKLGKQADVLYITRTWEFSSKQNLYTY
jgi:protein TonB